MNLVNKSINFELVGLNGNAFALMGAFAEQARREGWSKAEIDIVLKEARSDGYNHLLCTLSDHCTSDTDGVDDDEEYNGN